MRCLVGAFMNLQQRINKLPQLSSSFSFGKDIDNIHSFIFNETSKDKIEDLYSIHSLNYEILQGDKKGISSIRINDQYRLEFKISIDSEKEPTITICTIKDITNHYK